MAYCNDSIVHPNARFNGKPLTVGKAWEIGGVPGKKFDDDLDDAVEMLGIKTLDPNDPANLDPDDGYFDGLGTSCPVRADLIWA